jgi:hypothetical protein
MGLYRVHVVKEIRQMSNLMLKWHDVVTCYATVCGAQPLGTWSDKVWLMFTQALTLRSTSTLYVHTP